MSAASESGRPTTDRASRRRAGLLLSAALHLAVIGAVVEVRWPTRQLPAPEPLLRAVWLTLPTPAIESPTEPEPQANAAPAAPDAAAPAVEPRRAPRAESSSTTRAAPRTISPNEERAAAPAAEEDRPSSASLPPIDWEKERRAAVASVIEERSRRYMTFSLGDLIKEPAAPIEPVPPPFVDDCVIAHGRLQTFMAQMMGRCVREARGDLFAALMPDYLNTRPVCRETHPDAPGSVLSDGTEISTVKCELVARAERP